MFSELYLPRKIEKEFEVETNGKLYIFPLVTRGTLNHSIRSYRDFWRILQVRAESEIARLKKLLQEFART
jgi:hypothetical protein